VADEPAVVSITFVEDQSVLLNSVSATNAALELNETTATNAHVAATIDLLIIFLSSFYDFTRHCDEACYSGAT
jgi:hypothetical protein